MPGCNLADDLDTEINEHSGNASALDVYGEHIFGHGNWAADLAVSGAEKPRNQ